MITNSWMSRLIYIGPDSIYTVCLGKFIVKDVS